MMKGLLDQSDLVKTLFINVSSWMKHFLYDAMIKFDMFSGFEVQLLFINFLHSKGHLTVTLPTDDHYNPAKPGTWLEATLLPDESQEAEGIKDKERLAQLFIDFLKYLSLELSPKVTDFSFMPAPWIEGQMNPDEDYFSNEYSFYQLMISAPGREKQYLDIRRDRRDYQDCIQLAKEAERALE